MLSALSGLGQEHFWTREMPLAGCQAVTFEWAVMYMVVALPSVRSCLLPSSDSFYPKGLPRVLERLAVRLPLVAPQCHWARG